MSEVKLKNADKCLCVICDKTIKTSGNITCGEYCHEEFVKFCEMKFGVTKNVVDITTGITYKIPTRDIIENGLAWEDLDKYPQWKEDQN